MDNIDAAVLQQFSEIRVHFCAFNPVLSSRLLRTLFYDVAKATSSACACFFKLGICLPLAIPRNR